MSYLITNQNNFANVPYPSKSYPNATVKSGGCGACSVLNCVENMTELRFKMADWIAYVIANGGRIDGGTSITAILKALKRDYGFSYSATNDIAAVREHLRSGGMAVFHAGGAYGSWKGLLSTTGHYVCLAGMEGEYAVVVDSGWYSGKYSGAWRKSRIVKDYQNSVITVSFANLEKDKKYRTNGGTNYYLVTAPAEIKKDEDEEMIYKTFEDVPDWAKPAVQLRIDLGAIKDKDNMTVYDSNLVDWTTVDRENPYYKELADVPDYWQDDCKKLIDKCVIKGDGKNTIGMRKCELKAAIIAKRLSDLT